MAAMRLVQGRSGWWCIASSGTALVPASLVCADPLGAGRLTDGGRVALELTGITAPKPVGSYALTVLVTTACNLGCPYCFQNTGTVPAGRFDPPRIPRATLTPRTIDSIVDFARARMAEAGLSRLYVLLFGGEPLANPGGCAELLRRCGGLGGLTAGMVSNGTLLGPRVAVELQALGLRSVQITMDGPQWIHDAVRVTRAGRATFERILDNVAATQRATDLRFDLRVNLTPAVLPHLPALVAHLADRLDATRCRLQVAPVGRVGAAAAPAVVAAYGVGRRAGFRVPRPTDDRCPFCTERDGRTGAVVNADGTLFSCWESAGRSGFEVGTVDTGYSDYPTDRWVSCHRSDRALADAVDAGLLDLLWEERRCLRSR
jgi:uncharacterized protein